MKELKKNKTRKIFFKKQNQKWIAHTIMFTGLVLNSFSMKLHFLPLHFIHYPKLKSLKDFLQFDLLKYSSIKYTNNKLEWLQLTEAVFDKAEVIFTWNVMGWRAGSGDKVPLNTHENLSSDLQHSRRSWGSRLFQFYSSVYLAFSISARLPRRTCLLPALVNEFAVGI